MFVFFWVIPRRLIYICRRFGTLYLFHLQRQVPLKMEQIECSETSAYINQTPGNRPKENKQHSEHGESLKSRRLVYKLLRPLYKSLNFKQPVFAYASECIKKNYNFIYEKYRWKGDYCIIPVLSSTKCHLFHNLIFFCSNNMHVFHKPCVTI